MKKPSNGAVLAGIGLLLANGAAVSEAASAAALPSESNPAVFSDAAQVTAAYTQSLRVSPTLEQRAVSEAAKRTIEAKVQKGVDGPISWIQMGPPSWIQYHPK